MSPSARYDQYIAGWLLADSSTKDLQISPAASGKLAGTVEVAVCLFSEYQDIMQYIKNNIHLASKICLDICPPSSVSVPSFALGKLFLSRTDDSRGRISTVAYFG